MAKQLFTYRIEPGDPDHIPAYMIQEGVVEAEPNEIAQILSEISEAHLELLAVRPIDEAKIDIERFRIEVGSGLWAWHDPDYQGGPRCEIDRPYIEAMQMDSYGEVLADDVQ